MVIYLIFRNMESAVKKREEKEEFGEEALHTQ